MARTISLSDHARSCPADEIDALLRSASEPVLAALLENIHWNVGHLCRLLDRKNLSAEFLEKIAGNKKWLEDRRVQCAVVAHPRTPRRIALKLARELYLLDLLAIGMRPSAPPEVRKFAEEFLIARLPQVPLGQKLVLARRGSAHVTGELLAGGHERVVRVALENPRLTEAQVLRALANSALPAVALAAIAGHPRWSGIMSVRVALTRHPGASLDQIRLFLPALSRRDLDDLGKVPGLHADVYAAARRECESRAPWEPPPKIEE